MVKSGYHSAGNADLAGGMALLNLIYAPPGSALFSLAKTLTRVENLGHILAWTAVRESLADDTEAQNNAPLISEPSIDLARGWMPRLCRI